MRGVALVILLGVVALALLVALVWGGLKVWRIVAARRAEKRRVKLDKLYADKRFWSQTQGNPTVQAWMLEDIDEQIAALFRKGV